MAGGDVTFGIGITYGQSRYDGLNTPSALVFPNANAPSADLGYFGPNFLYDEAVVPEPASWLMLLGGFAFIGSAIRRRRAPIGPLAG